MGVSTTETSAEYRPGSEDVAPSASCTTLASISSEVLGVPSGAGNPTPIQVFVTSSTTRERPPRRQARLPHTSPWATASSDEVRLRAGIRDATRRAFTGPTTDTAAVWGR